MNCPLKVAVALRQLNPIHKKRGHKVLKLKLKHGSHQQEMAEVIWSNFLLSIDESHVKFEVDKPTTFLVNLVEPMKYALVSWEILSKRMISTLYKNLFGADKKWLTKRDQISACDRLLAHFPCFFSRHNIFFFIRTLW